MRILMFGWELPPHNSGGLGVACLGLAKALAAQGFDITFVLPKDTDAHYPFLKIISANTSARRSSFTSSYAMPQTYQRIGFSSSPIFYAKNLFEEVYQYSLAAPALAKEESFDAIHAHDWLSFGAGLAAKEVSGKPLLVHVHATEFDRTGGNGVNQYVYDREKEAMEKADGIIAVSNYTKNMIVERYGIDPSKIRVVHNAIEPADIHRQINEKLSAFKNQGVKIVVFVGRITLQKGPDYFLRAAKRVLEYNPDVMFIMAGSGDMEGKMVEESALLGISRSVLFTGFLRGEELAAVYEAADLFVMPSVSEPFGISALESLAHQTPVLISKQSGVSEMISHALKVDFWDTEEMANEILAVLDHDSLKECLRDNGLREVKKMSWQEAAQQCIEVYKEVMRRSLYANVS